jgi:cytochrome c
MKLIQATFVAAALSLSSGAAMADVKLAQSKACMACHAVDKKMVGPAYKDIAAKYASDASAAAKLAVKIQKGGVGVWGQIPMPANPAVSAAEADTLAKWVLSIK